MVGWWSTGEINEEIPLYDDLDPLKEWLVDPDSVQVQNPNSLSNVGLDICEIHSTGVKLEKKGGNLGSSTDEKMEKVSLLEVSNLFQGEVGLKENGVKNVSEMVILLEVSDLCQGEVGLKENGVENVSEMVSLLEVSDLCQGEVGLKENGVENVLEMVSLLEVSDLCQGEVGFKEKVVENVSEMVSLLEVSDLCQGEEGLKENGVENVSEMNGTKGKEGTDEVESGEKESASVTAEADSGDSSSDESSRNESSSITKSLSSSDGEDSSIKRIEEAEELEEGEVRDFDAHVMDFSDEEGEVPKEPISSKHEVKDLPPVPEVEVSLQPHHQMLPVGVILSIMGNRVIVDGSVRHNPLDEGSILWVTDIRSPLGLIDEIFGPVKNPYYMVRYNTEQEVPAGVRVGIAISFVVEFASQILCDKELYKKGYDASGENDEEIDEVEFSDDEKEAEYRRSLRQSKGPTNDGKGMKQEAWVGRKRSTFMGSRIQHKDIQTQQTNDGKGVKQEARVDRKWSTFMGSRIQYKDIQTQQTRPPLSIDLQHATNMLPQPTPVPGHPGVGPGCWGSSLGMTNANVAAPPRVTNFPQAMQSANIFGNPSQQLLIQHPPDTPWAPGFSSHPQNTGMQDDLAMQLQNQNLLLNNLVNMVVFQQQLQQLISNPGSTLPWFGAAPSLQPMGQNNFAPSPFVNGSANLPGTPGLGNEQMHGQALRPFAAPSLQPMGQNNFVPSPFVNGSANLPGTPGLGNEQIHGQALRPFAAPSLQPMGQNNFAPSPFVNGSTNLPGTPGLGNEQIHGLAPPPFAPSLQFNSGSSSSLQLNARSSNSRGRRPHQRGGGRFFGRSGRQPNR